MIPHLRRYQGLAVSYYGFALGRLGPGASSAFAQSGFNPFWIPAHPPLRGRGRDDGLRPSPWLKTHFYVLLYT